tara:strand:- start:417 stop:1256 length:840 start_codon:yes stop_codon:yes gene_type:complete
MRILTTLIILFFTSFANADETLSDKLSGYVYNLIPGEGTTEVSIDIRENYKPDYSILLVRELARDENSNIFSQMSLFNTEKLNDERIVANLGIGKRILSDNNNLMTGYNIFFDADEDGNIRSSLGGEIRNAVLGFRTNYYKAIQDADAEIVLDGYDFDFSSQIPYLYWADAFVSSYKWDGVNRDDIKGNKIGTDLQISPSVAVEAAYDDKDKKGMEDEYYFNLTFIYPPREGPSMFVDGISSSPWKENKNMESELLSKVKRQNKIVVEFNVTTTISRLN